MKDLPFCIKYFMPRKYSLKIFLAQGLLPSTNAEARGGSGGAFGFEILLGLALLVAIGWFVAQVNRETKRMIFGYIIAVAVILTVLQFVFGVLS